MTDDAPRTLPLVLCAIVENGRVLLLKRANPPYRGYWGLPGGKFAPGESVEAAARREAHEETGLETDCRRLVWAGTEVIVNEAGVPEAHFAMFLVELAPRGGVPRGGREGAVRWFPLACLSGEPIIETDRLLLQAHRNNESAPATGHVIVRRRGSAYRVERFDALPARPDGESGAY